ncbi:MAG: hypothetical protein ABJB05_11400 [Parafilimonas sp.]
MSTSEKNLKEEFLMKEYDAVRTEMNDTVKETRMVERNSLIATTVIWSWLATTDHVAYKQLKWLPVILVLFSAYRAFGLASHIDKIRNYLRKFEHSVLLEDDWGFEQYYKSKLTSRRISSYIFWVLLFLVTLIVPSFF